MATTTDQPIYDALARDFPQAAKLTREEMVALLEDEALFDAYFHTMPQAAEMHKIQEDRIRENVGLAEKNMALKAGLEGLRSETSRLYSEANDLKARWGHLEAAQRDAYKRFSEPQQLNRLRNAASGQEQLSESLVHSFLDGSMDEESFARQYKEIRKVYHRRVVSLEKWEEGKVVWRA